MLAVVQVESFLKGAARLNIGWVTARLPVRVDAFLADREQHYLLAQAARLSSVRDGSLRP